MISENRWSYEWTDDKRNEGCEAVERGRAVPHLNLSPAVAGYEMLVSELASSWPTGNCWVDWWSGEVTTGCRRSEDADPWCGLYYPKPTPVQCLVRHCFAARARTRHSGWKS